MIILASASPRRKMLLESAGCVLVTEPADIDEVREAGESPEAFVQRLSTSKAMTVYRRHMGEHHQIVAADTIVVHAGEILGKPKDAADAKRMIMALSGDVHSVWTGVCVINAWSGEKNAFVCETRVHFCSLDEHKIDGYLATGEPFDKAGSYGIQGKAARFVRRIEGSYTNVVGLPLCETIEVLDMMNSEKK